MTTCGSGALGSSSTVAVVDDLETLEGEESVNVLDRLGLRQDQMGQAAFLR